MLGLGSLTPSLKYGYYGHDFAFGGAETGPTAIEGEGVDLDDGLLTNFDKANVKIRDQSLITKAPICGGWPPLMRNNGQPRHRRVAVISAFAR